MNSCGYKYKPRGSTGGWQVIGDRPILGPGYGRVNDPFVIQENGLFKMWFSWRQCHVIAYTESTDGIHWEGARVVLAPVTGSDWEGHEVHCPTVVKRGETYHLWYAGSMYPTEINPASCRIGHAVSSDGIHFTRCGRTPELSPSQNWEGIAVTQPHVLWDEERDCYRMWYAGGRQHESDAIGYAESQDGTHWRKYEDPVLAPDRAHYWEMGKVENPFVMKEGDWYYLFYQGMDGDMIPGLGVARSRDGITGWQRHPSNPISAGKDGNWDWLGTKKVCVLRQPQGYQMWYTGNTRESQQLGIAWHPGFSLDFDGPDERGDGKGLGEINYYYCESIAMLTRWKAGY